MLNNHLVFIHIGFSLVEAIFGTEGLKVLTAAKTVIDPSNIFTCDYCVRALPCGTPKCAHKAGKS